VPITEIIPNALWQSDADPNIFAKLLDRGLTPAMVIDLQEFPAPAVPLDGSVLYVHWPIDDGPVPDERLLAVVEQAACAYIEQGGRVVTMCAQGRNRSGLVSALIAARILGLTGENAIRHVRDRVPEAISNADFAAWLDALR
jgi:protein-tyrosine phosphatase